MRKAFQNLVAANYPQIATELLEPLVRLLQLGRAHCGGDADRFLILAVIALRASQHHDFRASTTELLTSGEIGVLPGLGVNIRSIAESLGIPKETVRRKVQNLVDADWVARRDGQLYYTGRGFQELGPLREEIESLAARYHELVARLGAPG